MINNGNIKYNLGLTDDGRVVKSDGGAGGDNGVVILTYDNTIDAEAILKAYFENRLLLFVDPNRDSDLRRDDSNPASRNRPERGYYTPLSAVPKRYDNSDNRLVIEFTILSMKNDATWSVSGYENREYRYAHPYYHVAHRLDVTEDLLTKYFWDV